VKKIAVLLVVILTLGIMPVMSFAAAHDPYTGIYAKNYDGASSDITVPSNGLIHGNDLVGEYLLFKNVNFGENAPYRVDFYATPIWDGPTYTGGSIIMTLDDIDGPKIAEVRTRARTSSLQKLSYDLETDLVGMHDIYLHFKRNEPVSFSHFVFQATEDYGAPCFIYEEPDYLKDVTTPEMKEKVYTLMDLGLIEPFTEDEFNFDVPVTRGEFAVSMAQILNTKEGTYSQTFSDVSEDAYYASAVEALCQLGVVRGTADGIFTPDSYIKYNDAVTMAIRVLGYDNVALRQEKVYPQNYLNMANSIGLLKGMDGGEVLRRRDYVRLIYNTIHAEYLEVSALQQNWEQYTGVRGILSKTKNIYKGKGQITQNEVSNLLIPSSSVQEGHVLIDGVRFAVGETEATAMLGYNVVYYYTDDDAEKTLVSVMPDKNMELYTANTAKGDIVFTLTENKVVYETAEGDVEEISLPKGVHIIYNGVALEDSLKNTLDPKDFRGIVRVIKNSDGKSLLLIDQYYNIFVKNVSVKKEWILDEISGDSYIFSNDEDSVILYYKDRTVSFDAIDAKDVVSVYESKNNAGEKLIRLVISKGKASGMVTEISTEYIKIDSLRYNRSVDATQAFDVGASGTLCLDHYGDVVGFYAAIDSNSDNIGILLNFGEGESAFSSPKAQIFQKNGVLETLEFAEKIKIDGTICKSKEEILNGSAIFAGLNSMGVKRTLVRYRLDENGRVSMLDTHVSNGTDGDDFLKKINAEPVQTCYNGTSKIFSAVDGSTLSPWKDMPQLFGFTIQGDNSSAFYDERLDNYFPSTGLAFDIYGDLYTLDDDTNYVDYVVCDGTGNQSSWQYPFVFTEMVQTVKDDELVYAIRGMRDNAEVEYYIREGALTNPATEDLKTVKNIVDHLHVGDVLRVVINGKSEIQKAELLFLSNAAATSDGGISVQTHATNGLGNNVSPPTHYYYTMYGTVVNTFDTMIKVEYKMGSEVKYDYFTTDSVCMNYSYNNGRPKVQNNIPREEILVGDKIFNVCQGYRVRVVCVYDSPLMVE